MILDSRHMKHEKRIAGLACFREKNDWDKSKEKMGKERGIKIARRRPGN
jgi:hypothetical protein